MEANFLISGLALCAGLLAQTPIPISPPNTTGVQSPQSGATLPPPSPLPGNWAGVGAGYNPTGSPKATAWASFATLVSQSQRAWSYTTLDVVPKRGSVPLTSVRTGVATIVRTFGTNLFVLAFATAGATQSATATQASFSGGGILFYRFSRGFTAELGVRGASGTGMTNPIIEAGTGYAWED